MRVNALDHVNLVVDDLDAAARFYAELLGLERRDGPAPRSPREMQWMYDQAGRPIIHLNARDCPRTYERDVTPGPTGAIHHVALDCTGYDELCDRLRARGLEYRTSGIASIGLRQIFTLDPHGVLLELNFRAG